MDKYDAIIIGGGIGGLTCALLLAKKGMRVALFEKEKRPGGYCSSFSINGYTFDACIDSIGGLRRNEPLWRILKGELEILDKIEAYELNPTRRNVFPDISFDIPNDVTQYKDTLKTIFPVETEGIDKLFSLMEQVYISSIEAVCDDVMSDLLLDMLDKSYFEVFSSFVHDSKLQALLSSYCTFLGLPAHEVSMIAASNILMHYVRGGTFRIRGGIQSLSNVLASELTRCGGKVFQNEEVTSILSENGCATGIVTGSGKVAMAKYIISNVDVMTAVKLIKNCPIEKEKIKLLEHFRISGSFVVVYLGVKDDLRKYNLAPSMGYFSSYDLDAMLNKNGYLTFGFSAPSLLDASLAPSGCNTVVIHWPFCYNNNRKPIDKDSIAKKLINELSKRIPGITDHIVCHNVAGPHTLQRYTGNTLGAAYGWKQDVEFLKVASLLDNLVNRFFVVGHWAGLGGGVMPAVLSAYRVTKAITR